ncbi:hypothetical protein D3C77_372410 [compost metagenome]
MVAPAPGPALGETAGQQVSNGQQHHQHADQLQPGSPHRPVGRQFDQAQSKHCTRQGQVADPVGEDAQADDPGDGCRVQAQPAVQAIAQGHATDPGGEIKVEGITDEGHWQYLTHRQVMAGIGTPEQVIAAEQDEAAQRQPQTDGQGPRAVSLQ